MIDAVGFILVWLLLSTTQCDEMVEVGIGKEGFDMFVDEVDPPAERVIHDKMKSESYFYDERSSPQTIADVLSHRRAWQLLHTENIRLGVIHGDLPEQRVREIVKEAKDWEAKDWDMIRLGRCDFICSAEIKLEYPRLHFYFLTVVSCVLEVVIIRRRDKKKF